MVGTGTLIIGVSFIIAMTLTLGLLVRMLKRADGL